LAHERDPSCILHMLPALGEGGKLSASVEILHLFDHELPHSGIFMTAANNAIVIRLLAQPT
jgi:hypothetical protein